MDPCERAFAVDSNLGEAYALVVRPRPLRAVRTCWRLPLTTPEATRNREPGEGERP